MKLIKKIVYGAGILSSLFLPIYLGRIKKDSNYQLTFQDEFNSNQLSSWETRYKPGQVQAMRETGSERLSREAKYRIEDGILYLNIESRDNLEQRMFIDDENSLGSSIQSGKFKKTEQGWIYEGFKQKYGFFEIRCRMPKGSGLCSAFWLNRADVEYINVIKGENVFTDAYSEIDIFEQYGKERNRNKMTVYTGKREHDSKCYEGVDLSQDFHIWGLEWKEGILNWYLDGELIWEHKCRTPEQEMKVFISLYQGDCESRGEVEDLKYPVSFEVDYVRIWKEGEEGKYKPYITGKVSEDAYNFPCIDCEKYVNKKEGKRCRICEEKYSEKLKLAEKKIGK